MKILLLVGLLLCGSAHAQYGAETFEQMRAREAAEKRLSNLEHSVQRIDELERKVRALERAATATSTPSRPATREEIAERKRLEACTAAVKSEDHMAYLDCVSREIGGVHGR